jgi:cytochrome c biogenesis protein CcdA/thiol-disulfide isomerase/thioredoxin
VPLLVLVYVGGMLTIVSPCILPVLPFVFARADRPFVRGGLPLLVGMAATFAAVATLAAVGGGWAAHANHYGRGLSIALLALFGLALLFPALSDRLMNPLVGLGARLSQSADRTAAAGGSNLTTSLLLGVATGLLWAPCAGPILGLILTGAALRGASVQTSLLLVAYAAGAATSLALALLVGGRVLAVLRNALGISDWIRRGMGLAVLAAVAAIALGLDTGFLTRVSLASTAPVEQRLLDTLHPTRNPDAPKSSAVMTGGNATMSANSGMMSANSGMMMKAKGGPGEGLAVEGTLPSLAGAVEWLNSAPLTAAQLSGKVVLVDFWTYSCINCLRAIPYVRAWAEKYQAQGLVVIGVHTPEFAFEKNPDNVRKAVSDLKIAYPVAIDNDYAIWRAFKNQYWPAHYFIDGHGQIRHHHFGEGGYDESERVIQQLLGEIGASTASTDLVSVNAVGVEAAPDLAEVQSPETYLGYERAEHFVSNGGAVRDGRHVYATEAPRLNEWGLAGDWTIGAEQAALNAKDGRIVYRFHARDLHLVLGPGPDGKPVRFRITVDGAAPGASRGVDVDAEGQGVVARQRLYQLIRQKGPIDDHTFEIRFLDPGVRAYAFTFG